MLFRTESLKKSPKSNILKAFEPIKLSDLGISGQKVVRLVGPNYFLPSSAFSSARLFARSSGSEQQGDFENKSKITSWLAKCRGQHKLGPVAATFEHRGTQQDSNTGTRRGIAMRKKRQQKNNKELAFVPEAEPCHTIRSETNNNK